MIARLLGALALLVAAPVAARSVAEGEMPTAIVTVHGDQPAAKFDKRLFGQFAEHLGTGIYGGIWVGPNSAIPNIRGYRKDVVDALKAISVSMIRWPGGCFADEYHWREGIGPRGKRPVKINTHWGGVTEDNAVGTHEFMEFSELVGAEAYVSIDAHNRFGEAEVVASRPFAGAQLTGTTLTVALPAKSVVVLDIR